MGLITGIQDKNRQKTRDVKNYTAEQKFSREGGISPLPATPNPAPAIQDVFKNLMQRIMPKAQATQNRVPSKQMIPTPTTTPVPTPMTTPAWTPYKEAYDKFYESRGNPPISKHTELLAKLTYENPNLRRNPGIMVGVPLLESSGGKNVTFENNPVNWAIQVQKMGGFKPANWEEALTKMATGVSHRQKDYTAKKLLDTWRKTGDLEAFGEWYAPTSDNPEHGGKVYGKRLKGIDDEIKELLKSLGV